MLSILFDKFGEPANVLRLGDVPTPEPREDEVLIRMRARSVNPSDLYMVRGLYGILPQLPATPGLEGTGTIERVGAAVTGLHVGQRVIPLGVHGAWAEYVVAPATRVIPVPDPVNDETAAQFVVNPLTAWIMVVERLKVQPGEWLIQTAAGSTLGRIVLQIAKLRGFKTINVVRRRDQVEELKLLGADEVICAEDEDIVSRIRDICGNNPPRAAIDAVSDKTASDVIRSLGRFGEILLYGRLAEGPIEIESGPMLFRNITVRGFWLAEWFERESPEHQREVATNMMMMMAKGEIVPPVEAKYELQDFISAVRHAETPGRHGKVLLVG